MVWWPFGVVPRFRNQTDNLSTPVVIFSPSSSSIGVLGYPVVINFVILARKSEDLKGHVLD